MQPALAARAHERLAAQPGLGGQLRPVVLAPQHAQQAPHLGQRVAAGLLDRRERLPAPALSPVASARGTARPGRPSRSARWPPGSGALSAMRPRSSSTARRARSRARPQRRAALSRARAGEHAAANCTARQDREAEEEELAQNESSGSSPPSICEAWPSFRAVQEARESAAGTACRAPRSARSSRTAGSAATNGAVLFEKVMNPSSEAWISAGHDVRSPPASRGSRRRERHAVRRAMTPAAGP